MESSDKHILDTLKHIEDEIQSTLKDLSSIKQEMDSQSSEEEIRVFKFLYNLERLSFSKQFNPEKCLQKHYGFSEEKAEKYIFKFIEHSSEMSEKFGSSLGSAISESSSHSSEPQIQEKKRKGPKPYSEMTPEELAIAKAKKLEKANMARETESQVDVSAPEKALVSSEPAKQKRVIKTKKISDGIKIWNSFLKVVKLELDAVGKPVSYDELVKKAKEMKEADPIAYGLFSSTWAQDDDSACSNA